MDIKIKETGEIKTLNIYRWHKKTDNKWDDVNPRWDYTPAFVGNFIKYENFGDWVKVGHPTQGHGIGRHERVMTTELYNHWLKVFKDLQSKFDFIGDFYRELGGQWTISLRNEISKAISLSCQEQDTPTKIAIAAVDAEVGILSRMLYGSVGKQGAKRMPKNKNVIRMSDLSSYATTYSRNSNLSGRRRDIKAVMEVNVELPLTMLMPKPKDNIDFTAKVSVRFNEGLLDNIYLYTTIIDKTISFSEEQSAAIKKAAQRVAKQALINQGHKKIKMKP